MKKINHYIFTKLLPRLTLSFCAGLFLPILAVISPSVFAITALEKLPNFSELVEQSGPAVVNISTTRKVKVDRNSSSAEEELFKRYFGEPNPHTKKNQKDNADPQEDEEEISRDIGSGFIFSDEGYILTNAHVVKDAEEVSVKLTDKREFKATVIGVDINTDIAVLKIQGNKLPKVTIGDSTTIKVGEWVIAIGSPFDLDNSISAGIISAKAREIGDFLLLIQTDVAINPGNSGGPLINMRGEVIGINSQIYSRSGGYMGISFAIPIDDAIHVADQLKRYGRVTRGRMGIYLADVSSDVATALKLPTTTGALVSRIEQDGPAQKGGLLDGDIILKFNNTQIEKSTELRRLAAATSPNSKVDLTIWRKGIIKTHTITLDELPQIVDTETHDKKSNAQQPNKSDTSLGLKIKSINTDEKQQLGISSGVVIEHAEGRAAQSGLQADDIIFTINNQDVNSEKDFQTIINNINSKDPVVLLARRENITQYIAINPYKS